MDLLLLLWHRDFFKQVVDACRGYLGVDEETVGGKKSVVGKSVTLDKWEKGVGEVAGGGRYLCFIVYLWWELPPWVVTITLCKERLEEGKKKLEDSPMLSCVGFCGVASRRCVADF